MSDSQQQQQPSPLECLKALDATLEKVPGTRADHVQLQGMIGIIGMALQPKPVETDIAPDGLPEA